jgi:hypothetical protein
MLQLVLRYSGRRIVLLRPENSSLANSSFRSHREGDVSGLQKGRLAEKPIRYSSAGACSTVPCRRYRSSAEEERQFRKPEPEAAVR